MCWSRLTIRAIRCSGRHGLSGGAVCRQSVRADGGAWGLFAEFTTWDWVTLPALIKGDQIPDERMEHARKRWRG